MGSSRIAPWQPGRTKPLAIVDMALRTTRDAGSLTISAGPKARTVVKRLAPGIYSYGPDAYRFFARVNGTLHSQVFRPDRPLPPDAVRASYVGWRATISGDVAIAAQGTLAGDVDSYLTRVVAMPSYRTRKQALGEWVKALGPDRPRSSITAGEIEAVMQRWLLDGYAPKTVGLRRTDLIQVWVKLDGRRAPNPARDASSPPAPPPEARAMLDEHVKAAFAQIELGKTKIRLWIMATTGLPQKQIKDLGPDDIDLVNRRIWVRSRRKGAGAAGGWRPIAPAAVEALRAFVAYDCFGEFNNSTLYRVWTRACRRAGIPGDWRPYDLRHSFGTWVYRATGDLSSTADLLGHAKTETARRYTMGARMDVAKRATDLVQLPSGLGAKVERGKVR